MPITAEHTKKYMRQYLPLTYAKDVAVGLVGGATLAVVGLYGWFGALAVCWVPVALSQMLKPFKYNEGIKWPQVAFLPTKRTLLNVDYVASPESPVPSWEQGKFQTLAYPTSKGRWVVKGLAGILGLSTCLMSGLTACLALVPFGLTAISVLHVFEHNAHQGMLVTGHVRYNLDQIKRVQVIETQRILGKKEVQVVRNPTAPFPQRAAGIVGWRARTPERG